MHSIDDASHHEDASHRDNASQTHDDADPYQRSRQRTHYSQQKALLDRSLSRSARWPYLLLLLLAVLLLAVPAGAAPIPGDGAEGGGSITALVFYVTLALGLSFLCSVLEAVVLSSSVSHAEFLAESGSRAGNLMLKHKANVERPISAILTLNTIAHTAGATGAGAEAVAVFGGDLVFIITVVLTLLILVLSEIIPKTLGAIYWKQLTPFAAYAIQILLWIFYPAVWIFEKMGQLLRPHEDAPTITRSDLEMLAKISAEEGALLERENRILRNLLHLSNARASDVMTPRTVVLAMQEDTSVGEAMDGSRLPYSRIPVYGDNIDNVTGYVLRHDIIEQVAADQYHTTLAKLKRDIHAIPETTGVDHLLNEFIAKQEHIFLVLDEYGGTAGIVTMEDAIESLLGIEITDESDLVADLRQMAQQRYRRRFIEQSAEPEPRRYTASEPRPATGSASD
ncbi:MAG: HlyC/CorC family transporter [Chloroflexi bacterium]|nr:HlyC/CorC family transporter [Chloroflexota bacterium]